ncbi:bifunctional nitrilase/nitrile hydratase NIT4B [Ricinus communis]|uniref:bifunctional nitrilase/nitrile hydratase NIT4B n=1 Tax=Ricinus communis TaxID=3988 RepID=UPI00201A8AA1|nr:bifunctional nitrilase/nitrile hydratase NIT4B [Ricinus communis]
MELVEVQVQPSSSNINEPDRQPQRRRCTAGHRPDKRVRIPPICVPAMIHLKQELGLRSDAETIHWLIHQVRPQLIDPPAKATKPPISHRNRPSCTVLDDFALKTDCMEYLNCDKPISYPPLAVTGALIASQRVRATVVQASTVFFDTPATMDKAERLIAGAAAYGSKLVVFPEAFVGGHPRCMKLDAGTTDDDLHKYYASAINVPGAEFGRLAKIAGKYKVHLVIGVVERAGPYLLSTILFFNSVGQYLGEHRKLMLMPSETAMWYSGEKSSPPVYETSIGKVGGLVGWDNKLPLLRTELYAKGIDIYCAPSSDGKEIWKASMIHIALEGGCFILSANQFCRRRDCPVPPGDSDSDISLDAITCPGGSVIVSPSGTILAGPNYQDECLISADLDLVEITRAKTGFSTVGSNLKPNNVDWTANEPTPVLLTSVLEAVPHELSC